LEILVDSVNIQEVYEPRAKALPKRHMENFPTTSVNPGGVWDGGRVPGVDELDAKVTVSEHLTNPPM